MNDDDSGQHVAAKQSARELQEIEVRSAEAVAHLESSLSGDPQVALVAADLDSGSRVPLIHKTVITFYLKLEPLLHRRAPKRWSGEYKDDDPIAEIKIPTGPQIDGYGQHETEIVNALADVHDWQLRRVERPGDRGTEQSRLFMSPMGYLNTHRALVRAKHALGISVDGQSERNQQEVSRI